MSDNKTSLTARLLHSARDLVWQDETPVRMSRPEAMPMPENVPATPVNPESTQEIPETGMGRDLFQLVMERPTAYSALTEAIDALAELPMDEATRYRSAFAVLKKTQQRTVEQNMQAITTHLDVLAAEQSRFANQSRAAEDDEINARLEEVKALHNAITLGRQQMDSLRSETEQRIRKIQEDLEHKRARATELELAADMRKKAIEKTIQDFSSAANSVKARLDADQERVKRHLTVTATA